MAYIEAARYQLSFLKGIGYLLFLGFTLMIACQMPKYLENNGKKAKK